MSFLDTSEIIEDYDQSLNQYGPGPKALLWWDYNSMAIRFRELVKDIPVEGKTILDAGSGMGDVLPYLYSKSGNFRYLGVDKSKRFIDIAKKRYEGQQFRVGDPFKQPVGMFDVVISSGVMNGNVKNWQSKRKQMIASLYDQTGEVLAFNMAGGLKPIQHDTLIAYADAEEIFEFCKTLSKRLILRTHYLEKDFTIVLYKKAT